jgi:hypothetical protein
MNVYKQAQLVKIRKYNRECHYILGIILSTEDMLNKNSFRSIKVLANSKVLDVSDVFIHPIDNSTTK